MTPVSNSPRSWRRAAAAATLALLAGSCGETAEPWNVLLVTLDTTRADRMSCYGYGVQTTPNMDELAAQGVLFERAISTAGITPMSHSSILTGLNNYRHGMRVFYSEEVSHRLKDEVDTLPEILARRGYNTAAMVSSYPVSEVYNLQQGFETFITGIDTTDLDLSGQQKHNQFWQVGGKSNTQRRGDETVNDALKWLDDNGEAAPWCMWVHMFDVHDYSIVPPLEYAQRFGIDAYPTEVGGKSRDWRERMYDPEMVFLDDQVDRLLNWLEEKGQLERTIVVITADHGQGLNDGYARHQWAKHRLLYDWSLHVPLILKIPGGPKGLKVADQVRTIDILPTVLEALDVPNRLLVEGESMIPLLNGEKESVPRLAYADALNKYDQHSPAKGLPKHSSGENLYMVSDGEWKLIYHEIRGEHELFNLNEDPLELRNLAKDHPEQIDRLKGFLVEKDAMNMEKPGQKGDGPNASTLQDLGYVGDEEDEEGQ